MVCSTSAGNPWMLLPKHVESVMELNFSQHGVPWLLSHFLNIGIESITFDPQVKILVFIPKVLAGHNPWINSDLYRSYDFTPYSM
jgi:hypothetical protein